MKKEELADLEEFFNTASKETLVDLWRARYGDDWVPYPTVHDDGFFSLVAVRLITLKMLVEHTFFEQGVSHKAYRLKEPEQ